ncbi:MAG: hypothetical protein J6J39_04910 [Clostridia bacterium]|nr:hypothetical protein [Clostridia bacterium]
MSLSFDEIAEVYKAWEEMDERLNKLIGFNPATSNHYGIIQLYNQRIDSNTTDEEIIKIRSAYLSWKNDIIAILAEYNLFFEDDKFCELFSIDSMSGRLSFLDEEVDIYQSADVYRKIIKRMLNLIDHFQNRLMNRMKGQEK